MSETILTTSYNEIADEAGHRILDRMEQTSIPWTEVLVDEMVGVNDFAHWLEGSQDRMDRFAAVRRKGAEVVS